jgi:hypothetical protein
MTVGLLTRRGDEGSGEGAGVCVGGGAGGVCCCGLLQPERSVRSRRAIEMVRRFTAILLQGTRAPRRW